MVEIRKNVPMMPHGNAGKGRKSAYPLGDMDVGDSFTVGAKDARKARAAASYANINTSRRFATRTLADGNTGIWRTA